MVQQMRDIICDDYPIVKILKTANPLPVSSFLHQRENPGEELGSCGMAETEHLEPVSQCNSEVQPRIWKYMSLKSIKNIMSSS